MVGRTSIIEDLKTRLVEVGKGRGRFVLLKGEAGIGKSRIMDAFKEHCRKEGITWLQGNCTYGATGNPYLPIRQALGDHLTHDDKGAGGASLATVAPSLRALVLVVIRARCAVGLGYALARPRIAHSRVTIILRALRYDVRLIAGSHVIAPCRRA